MDPRWIYCSGVLQKKNKWNPESKIKNAGSILTGIMQRNILAWGRDRKLDRSQTRFEPRNSDIAPVPRGEILRGGGFLCSGPSWAQGHLPGSYSQQAPMISCPAMAEQPLHTGWSKEAWWDQACLLAGPSMYKSSISGGQLRGAPFLQREPSGTSLQDQHPPRAQRSAVQNG